MPEAETKRGDLRNCQGCVRFRQDGDGDFDSRNVWCEINRKGVVNERDSWSVEETPGLITGIFPKEGSFTLEAIDCKDYEKDPNSRWERAHLAATSAQGNS
jgi:hypothetical protein